MQIKDLEELEVLLDQIACELDKIESLSRILLDGICGGDNLKSADIEKFSFRFR
jgi:hypothetical protein